MIRGLPCFVPVCVPKLVRLFIVRVCRIATHLELRICSLAHTHTHRQTTLYFLLSGYEPAVPTPLYGIKGNFGGGLAEGMK